MDCRSVYGCDDYGLPLLEPFLRSQSFNRLCDSALIALNSVTDLCPSCISSGPISPVPLSCVLKFHDALDRASVFYSQHKYSKSH